MLYSDVQAKGASAFLHVMARISHEERGGCGMDMGLGEMEMGYDDCGITL